MARISARDVQQEFSKMRSSSADLPVTTIYVLVVKQNNLDGILDREDYTCHHVICKRKSNSIDSRVFVDENGRTYSSWEKYKQENDLERGIMIAPRDGRYSFDENGNAHLEIVETPAENRPTVREVQQELANNYKATGSDGRSNIIYALVTNTNDFNAAENLHNFIYHPVIRSKDYRTGAEIFVDEDGNSYKDWECYKSENKLDCGVMITPLNGCYTFDEAGNVKLEASLTPASKARSGFLTISETQQNYAKMDSEENTNTAYIMVTTTDNLQEAVDSREFTTHSIKRGNRYFEDDAGETYASWDIYKNNNNLPVGIMVAPLNGKYSFDKNGDVELEVCLTPAVTQQIHQVPRTIFSQQQFYAKLHKYMNPVRTILHVLGTSTNYSNDKVLEAKEFMEFCVERKLNQANSFFYEDENGKKYFSWKSYLQDNSLPDGNWAVPQNGDYTFDNHGNVQLEVVRVRKVIQKYKNRTNRTIFEIQQDFAKNCGFNSEVIWDLLSSEQSSILRKKIKSLIPDQKKGQNKIEEIRKTIFENVWAQRKFTNGNSLSAIIYVFVADCKTRINALNATEYSCHPLFRTRKCIAEGNSSNCCMIYIDECGRVYQTWNEFLENNELPVGIMVAPHKGIYTTDHKGEVQLDINVTPNSSFEKKALNIADSATAVAGLGAAAVPVAGMMMTIAPAVLVGAGTVCMLTTAYSVVRSACNLQDRKKHKQPIGFDNAQARSAWLGLSAGIIGLGAAGKTKALASAASAGKDVSIMTKLVVNGMNISSIVLSGTGVANGILDLLIKYNDDEEISSFDIVQLAASLVLFTHSVSNFRLASTIINETTNATIQDYRKSLSNRQRKIFDKMSKETIRIQGESRGKFDIIRSVNEMPSKQYLNDLYKVNKELNKAKVKPSFGSDGKGIVLNNELQIDSKVLRNTIQHNQGPNVLKSITQPIPESHSGMSAPIASRLLLSNNNIIQSKSNAGIIGRAFISLPKGILIYLGEYGTRLFEIVTNAEDFGHIITTLANVYCEDIFRFLMKLAQEFVEENLDEIRAIIKTFVSAESILNRLFLIYEKTFKHLTTALLKEYKNVILKKLKEYFMSLNPNSNNKFRCKICGGNYSISNV